MQGLTTVGRPAQRALAVCVAATLLGGGCRRPSARVVSREEAVVWKQLGAWSGRGNLQTESFVGLTGSLRMQWQTRNESPKGKGSFRLILHSAISGRELQQPVDHEGVGEGTAYVAEDPRVFFMSAESSNLDWSFSVEEAVFGSRVAGSAK
jgi:hypothetical protein